MESRLIVEIGSGAWPWPLQEVRYRDQAGFDVRTPLQVETACLRASDRYICIDRLAFHHEAARKNLEQCQDTEKYLAQKIIEFQTVTSCILPLTVASVDIVIMCNVLSAPLPERKYLGTFSETTYPEDVCVIQKDKKKLLDEALRILKQDGSLILANDLTPNYATEAMKYVEHLCEQGELSLCRQFGSYIDTDDWIICHQQYQKPHLNQPISPQIEPWTDAQRTAIQFWKRAWECAALCIY